MFDRGKISYHMDSRYWKRSLSQKGWRKMFLFESLFCYDHRKKYSLHFLDPQYFDCATLPTQS